MLLKGLVAYLYIKKKHFADWKRWRISEKGGTEPKSSWRKDSQEKGQEVREIFDCKSSAMYVWLYVLREENDDISLHSQLIHLVRDLFD